MHELSIARSLLRLAEQHRPPGSSVKALRVQVGPLQAIDPEAMLFSWQAVTLDTELAGAKLHLEMLPWRLRCPKCNRQWHAESLDTACQCGSTRGIPVGGDELRLDSLEVTEYEGQDKVPTTAGE